jgi:serine/threonine-protein kinase
MELGVLQHDTRWEVVRTIASGGMGTVFEARQLGSHGFRKRVALKVLNEDVAKLPDRRRQLIDEARLVADLVHDNIVQIYQLVESGNHTVLVMEYCDGITLHRMVNRHVALGRPMPVDLAAFIASRVCRALEYAHAQTDPLGRPLGIVHRDVTPTNILVSLGGVVKLGDFGIAKAAFIPDDEGQTLRGKEQYMSPEQASFGRTDGRSDLFSLGVVLREAVKAGVPGAESASIYTLRADLPTELARIVEVATAERADARFADAAQMRLRLEEYLYGDGFGPTNNKLEAYLRDIFPELFPGYAPPMQLSDGLVAMEAVLDDHAKTVVRKAHRTVEVHRDETDW